MGSSSSRPVLRSWSSRRMGYFLVFVIIARVIRLVIEEKNRGHKEWRIVYNQGNKLLGSIVARLSGGGKYPQTYWTPLLPFYVNRWLNLVLTGAKQLLQAQTFRSERIKTPDGGLISVEWLDTPGQRQLNDDAPLFLVLHTIEGHSGNHGCWVRDAAERGWRVAVFNRRGAGNLPLKTPRFNVLGCPDDVHCQTRHACGKFPDAKFVGMTGLSAGSALLISYLGKYAGKTPVNAGACLCPPYDVDFLIEQLDANHPVVAQGMLWKMKQTFVSGNEHILDSPLSISNKKKFDFESPCEEEDITNSGAKELSRTRSLQEFFRAQSRHSLHDVYSPSFHDDYSNNNYNENSKQSSYRDPSNKYEEGKIETRDVGNSYNDGNGEKDIQKSSGLRKEKHRQQQQHTNHDENNIDSNDDNNNRYIEQWRKLSDPKTFFQKVKTPVFVLSSQDDPICLQENIPSDTKLKQNGNYAVMITPHGSHIAYNDGVFGQRCFAIERSLDFFEAVMSEYRAKISPGPLYEG